METQTGIGRLWIADRCAPDGFIASVYEALDRVVARLAPDPLREIAATFAAESIVLADNHQWLSTGEISVFGDVEAETPGIHSSVQRLAMWPRLDVPERPAVEKTIEWLQSLTAGKKLAPAELKRVRFALQRDPVRIWQACQHWLTHDNTWAAVGRLKFRLTMQELTKWSDLAPSIKKATANFQMLSEETTRIEPFSALRNLADSVEFRVTRCDGGGAVSMHRWLEELASGFCRVRIGSDEETQRIRTVGQRLRTSQWTRFSRIQVTPYVEGDPAGEPTTPKAFWSGVQIYAADVPIARLHKDLADEIIRPFTHNGIASTIAACIDRDREFVYEYLATSFDFDPEALGAKQPQSDTQPDARTSTNGQSSPEAGDSQQGEDESNPDDENEDDESAFDDDADDDNDTPRPHRPDSPHTPTLIERYANQRGFRGQRQTNRFTHSDGRWIGKNEQPFHWAEHRADGERIKRFWVCEQRLSRGIEIVYDLWQTIKDAPEETAIVLLGEDHAPIALSGTQLIEQKNSGFITVFPARYRLVTAESSSATHHS